jgi:hypothetical protein
MTSEHKVAADIDKLFKCLDAAKLTPESIIKSDAHREHYESLIMFAFRKLQAARYRRKRVNELLATRKRELRKHTLEDASLKKFKSARMTATLSRSATEFTFELCAFLAAIRSAIDFLARVCGEHSKGVQVDSITAFTKLIDKGRSGPTLDVIKEHIVWLRGLRDYRDYLVHRLCISTTSGGQVESENGVSVTTPYPVVVPATTPQHFPDTRRARHLDEPKTRFMTLTSEMTFTDIDGNKRLMERKIEIEPAPGYIRIEHVMARELTAFEAFLCAVVDTLVKLDFQPAPIA